MIFFAYCVLYQNDTLGLPSECGSEKVLCVRIKRSRYVRKRSQIRRFLGFGRGKTTFELPLRSQFASRLRT